LIAGPAHQLASAREKSPQNQGFRPIVRRKRGHFAVFFGGSRKRYANVFVLSQIGNPRRKQLAHKTLSLHPRNTNVGNSTDTNCFSGISGCLNSGFLYISLHAVPASQAIDTQLGARQRWRPPTMHRGRAQRIISAGSWDEIEQVAGRDICNAGKARAHARRGGQPSRRAGILASRAAPIVAFRSNLTPCGWGLLWTLRGPQRNIFKTNKVIGLPQPLGNRSASFSPARGIVVEKKRDVPSIFALFPGVFGRRLPMRSIRLTVYRRTLKNSDRPTNHDGTDCRGRSERG
jgi:hypothetical protein